MRKLACFLLAAMLLLCGCSEVSYVQVNLVVHAIGIDVDDNDELRVAYQIFSPDKSSGSGSGPTDASSSNVSTVVARGRTLYEAEENLELQMGRKAFFGNTELIVIGSGLTGRKLSELISYFRTSPDLYLGVNVVYSSSDAVKALAAKFPQGNASSQILRETVDAAVEDSCAASARIIEINNALSERGSSLMVPVVTVVTGESAGDSSNISNMVYGSFSSMLIKNDYPVAVVDRNCAKGVRLLDGSAETMSFNVAVGENIAAVRVENMKIERKVRIASSGYPVISVSVKGVLTVKDNPNEMLSEVIRRAAQEEMMSLCSLAYEKVILEQGADVVDIGRMLRKYQADYYEWTAQSFDEVVKNTLFEVDIRLKDC